MNTELIPEKFRSQLKQIVRSSKSLEELDSHLQAQQFVRSVKLENHVIKTFPPRREFTLEIRVNKDAIAMKTLTIAVTETNQLIFHDIH